MEADESYREKLRWNQKFKLIWKSVEDERARDANVTQLGKMCLDEPIPLCCSDPHTPLEVFLQWGVG